jgi:hypothetical protein
LFARRLRAGKHAEGLAADQAGAVAVALAAVSDG